MKREKEERFQLLATDLDVRPLSFSFLSFTLLFLPYLSWIIFLPYLLWFFVSSSHLNPEPSTLNHALESELDSLSGKDMKEVCQRMGINVAGQVDKSEMMREMRQRIDR